MSTKSEPEVFPPIADIQSKPDASPAHTCPSSVSSPSTPINPSTGTTEKRVHVNNIPFRWREADLLQLFSPFGETKQVEVVYNDRGSKGFGFITFTHAEDADRAIAEMSGKEFESRRIEVNEATRKRLDHRPSVGSPRVATGDSFKPATLVNNNSCGQYSSQMSTLLWQQKQMLAQQQLQQYLVTQQQSDMIAAALGLPTSNLASLLATLQSPTAAMATQPQPTPMLTIDPMTIHLQQLHALPFLQQTAAAAAVPTAQSRPQAITIQNIAGQMQAVPTSCYTQAFPMPSADLAQYLSSTTSSLYMPTEMSQSATKLRTLMNTAQRFTPY